MVLMTKPWGTVQLNFITVMVFNRRLWTTGQGYPARNPLVWVIYLVTVAKRIYTISVTERHGVVSEAWAD